MAKSTPSKIYRRISRWRWQAPLIAFLLVLAHQLVEHIWLIGLSRWQHFATQVFFYGLVGPTLTWWALTTLRQSVVEAEAAEQALAAAHERLTKLNEQLTCLLRLNRRLAEAEDEDDLYRVILETPLEVISAPGCSFFRFDERQKPLPALHHGALDVTVFESWSAQLADAHLCQECHCHATNNLQTVMQCPLSRQDSSTPGAWQAYCMRLTRGSYTYGFLNVYLPQGQEPTDREKSLLEAVTQEISLALESHILRTRELKMLSRLQRATRSHGLNEDLAELVKHTVEVLEIDGAALFVPHMQTGKLQLLAQSGDLADHALGVIQNHLDEAPLSIPSIDLTDDGILSVHVASLRSEERGLGNLVLWAIRPNVFTRRRTRLIEIVAGQAALLIENYRLYLQGEHRAALAERTRLAQEIHDGLAQTLGYLKLRTAQIQGWLDSGDSQRTMAGLDEIRQLLNEAYMDAREAIDGLHLRSDIADFSGWIEEIISEFETLSGITVDMTPLPQITPSLEVSTQLQRVMQEALSNIRKHAHATRVRLLWEISDDCLVLQIADNGWGFDPDDVPPAARHGLEIMQERANLLDANFTITSQMGKGTRVMLKLPLEETAGDVMYG